LRLVVMIPLSECLLFDYHVFVADILQELFLLLLMIVGNTSLCEPSRLILLILADYLRISLLQVGRNWHLVF
jgi:hypothetical protein